MTRHDRTGDEIEPDEHDCDHGFIDRDADNPRPCLICKPWLAPARLRRKTHADADQLRATREKPDA